MKPFAAFAALVCALSIPASPLVAGPLYRVVPQGSAAVWRAPSNADVTAAASDATTQSWTFSGIKGGTAFRCLLSSPVSVPVGTQHIAFWLSARDITVKPIVTDASGEEFLYGTRSQGNGWRYVSTLLIDPYGGGAINQREIASHGGGDGNGIPNWPLTLKGFEVTSGALTSDTFSVRDLAFDMSKQGDAFGQWGLDGRYLKTLVPGAEQPFVFASDLFRESGKYHVIWRAYDLSETRLMWQGEKDYDYDSDHPGVAPADRVQFPVGTLGTYVLRVSVIDREAGPTDLDARHDVTYRLHILRGMAPSPPVADGTRPLATLLSINPTRHSLVYAASEPKVVTVRIWKPTPVVATTWNYWWRQGDKSVTGTPSPVVFGAAPYVDQAVTLTGWDGAANPTVIFGAQVTPTGAPMERREVTVGVETPAVVDPLKVSAAALTHDDVVAKYGNLHTIGNMDHEIFDITEPQFEKYVDELQAAGYNTFIFRLSWRRLNPLPGVGDFRVLDQRVAYLDKKQMPYMLQINWGFADQPDWLDYDLMEDQSGDTQVWGGDGKLPTASDPKLRAGIRSLITLLSSHYLADKNFIAYEFLGIGCDWLQPDAPYMGITIDFSPAARGAFQRYLKDTKGYTLASINSRYGTSYTSFADIPLPSPNFTGQPDFTPQWRDFMQFKYWFPADYINYVAQTVRALDAKRYISLYAMGGVWMPLASFKALGIQMANGGGENEHQPAPRYSHEMLYGLTDRTESVSCEFSSEIRLDSVAFNMLTMGGLGTSINNFWRPDIPVYAGPDGERQKAYTQKWFKVLDELKDSKAVVDDVAIVCSPDDLMYNTRTIFGDVAWFPDWALGRKIYHDENLRPQWVYEDDITRGLPGKRLAVFVSPNSHIVEPGTIPLLVDYVKRGGSIVIDLNSGSQTPTPGCKPYMLWKALGLATPDVNPAVFSTKSMRYQTTIATTGTFWPANGTIVFNDPVYFCDAIPGGKPLLKDAEGRVFCWEFKVGTGTVYAFPGNFDYDKSAPFIGALYAKLGGKVPITVREPEIKTAWLKTANARYLVVHRYLTGGYLGDHAADARIRAMGSVTGNIAINDLPAGRYTVTTVIAPKASASFDASDAELKAKGIGYDLCRGETAVYRIEGR